MASFVQAFRSRRIAAITLLGFAQGLPLALTAGLLQAWMASEKVDLTLIGIFSLVGLPYTVKFLWSPLMDRFVPPFLGRRRGWMLLTQIGLILFIAGMAFANPVLEPKTMALLALIVAFLSASQDIVVDAYKVEVLTQEEYGPGASSNIMAYRLGYLFSGAIGLILADHMSWNSVYLIMAAMMSVGVLTTLWAPEPKTEIKPPRSLKEAVVLPWIQFLKRRGSGEIIAFIVLYRLDVIVAIALTTPFMLSLGFTKTDIGAINKGFGVASTIVGVMLGGMLMSRISMKQSLWTFGILQGISNLTFMYLAHVGHSYPTLIAAIALENFFSGMGTAAFTVFLMSLCDKRFTATQYALLSSLMAVTRVVASAPTGYLAKNVGWETYFVVATLLAIPGLLLLLRYDRWVFPVEAK